jgi:hypothetical protein
MAFFTEANLRAIGRTRTSVRADSTRILKEEASLAKSASSFDVFLLHAIKDTDVILGVKTVLVRKGLTVYGAMLETG